MFFEDEFGVYLTEKNDVPQKKHPFKNSLRSEMLPNIINLLEKSA
jgi:hypothetical protein